MNTSSAIINHANDCVFTPISSSKYLRIPCNHLLSSDDGGRSASSAGISSGSLPTFPAGIPSDDLPVIAVSTTGSDSPLRPPVANPERPPTYNLPVHLRHSGRSSARQLRRAGTTEQQNVPAYPGATSNANSPANIATTTSPQDIERSSESSRVWVRAEATERQYPPALLVPSAAPTPSFTVLAHPDATTSADTVWAPVLPASSARHLRDSRRYFESSQWLHPDAGAELQDVGPALLATDGATEQHSVVQFSLNEDQDTINISIEPISGYTEERYQNYKEHLYNPGVSSLKVEATFNRENNWSLSSLEGLGKAFAHLKRDDRRCLCKMLKVQLPIEDGLVSNGEVIDLSLPKVESLEWESHRNQLPLIGFRNFTHLTRLEIRSSISFRDCEMLLRHASGTLQFCHIEEVIDNNDLSH
ncbi:hypothetical protein C0989_005596, partial [Termitomyces sp. Mn162]